MARILLAVPADLGDRLAREAVHHGHEVVGTCSHVSGIGDALAQARPTCVLALAEPDLLDEGALARADAHGVRVVALVGTAAQRRHAAALRLRETVDAASDWSDIDPMLGGLGVPDPPRPAARGTVVAVWGPIGSPGRTSVAITLAAEFAAIGHRTLLADADTHGASVAPALGLLDEAPGFAAACRLAGTDSLDPAELDRIAQHYDSPAGSFRVLTGIGRPRRWPELSDERVTSAIAAMRAWSDIIVLDMAASLETDEEISSDLFAPRRNAATLAALRSADTLVIVGAADPVGLSRLLRTHADALDAATTSNVTVVMNRVRATAMGLAPATQVRQALARFGGIHDPVIVPHDQHAFDSAVLGGRTVTDVAPRSPARVALRDLAATLAPAPVERRRSRRRRGRG